MPDKKNAKPSPESSTPTTPKSPQTQWDNHDHPIASMGPAPDKPQSSWPIPAAPAKPKQEKRLVVTEDYKNRDTEVYDLEIDLIIGKEIDVLERELTPQEIEENLLLAFQKMYTQIDEAIAQGKAKKRERKPPITMAPLLTHQGPTEGAKPFMWDFWNTPVHPLKEPDVYTDPTKYHDLLKGLPAIPVIPPGKKIHKANAKKIEDYAKKLPVNNDMGKVKPSVYIEKSHSDGKQKITNLNNPLKNDGRKEMYDQFGNPLVKKLSQFSTANKYKALYMIAQKRQESGFRLQHYHGNLFNITGKGDAGSIKYAAPEYNKKTGKYEMIEQDYAVYSSNDAAAVAYINLIKGLPRYKDAWNALTDNKADIKDFASAIKKGGYATDPDYATELGDIFKSVKNDYQKIITSEISGNNKKIDNNNKYLISSDATQEGIMKTKNENVELSTINEKLNSDLNELTGLK